MLNVFKNKLSQIHKQSKEAKELLRFIGPGILVTVGFIDPGNWAANLAAGADYGYALLWVVTLSTLMLILLQHNVAHLGIVTGECLSEAATRFLPKRISRPILVTAISDIYDSLVDSYYGDKDARGKMHIAQCLAGMAFSNALLGIAHSLAHKTGAMFDIPHGCCNAILLPSVIQYNAKVCADRYATIARMLGLTGNTDKQLTDALIDSIKELNKKLGIAQTYKENGVSEELFKQHIDEIAANAVFDPCTGSNPRKIDAEGMKKVLTCAYYGEPVTF